MEAFDGDKESVTRAVDQALEALPDAVGVVLVVVRQKGPEPSDMMVDVASAFRGTELSDEAMRDLFRTLLG